MASSVPPGFMCFMKTKPDSEGAAVEPGTNNSGNSVSTDFLKKPRRPWLRNRILEYILNVLYFSEVHLSSGYTLDCTKNVINTFLRTCCSF